jgi:hypothetical protein
MASSLLRRHGDLLHQKESAPPLRSSPRRKTVGNPHTRARGLHGRPHDDRAPGRLRRLCPRNSKLPLIARASADPATLRGLSRHAAWPMHPHAQACAAGMLHRHRERSGSQARCARMPRIPAGMARSHPRHGQLCRNHGRLLLRSRQTNSQIQTRRRLVPAPPLRARRPRRRPPARNARPHVSPKPHRPLNAHAWQRPAMFRIAT